MKKILVLLMVLCCGKLFANECSMREYIRTIPYNTEVDCEDSFFNLANGPLPEDTEFVGFEDEFTWAKYEMICVHYNVEPTWEQYVYLCEHPMCLLTE